jgi:uncharacterized protein (TIGR03067 family)
MGRLTILTFASLVTFAATVRSDDKNNDSLDGTWLPVTAELGGKPFPEEIRKSMKLVLKGDQYTVIVGMNPDKGTCKANSAANPKTLDITGTEGPNKGKTILAIYEQKGDTLKVCYELGVAGRPKEFKTKEGTQLFLVTYKREAK